MPGTPPLQIPVPDVCAPLKSLSRSGLYSVTTALYAASPLSHFRFRSVVQLIGCLTTTEAAAQLSELTAKCLCPKTTVQFQLRLSHAFNKALNTLIGCVSVHVSASDLSGIFKYKSIAKL